MCISHSIHVFMSMSYLCYVTSQGNLLRHKTFLISSISVIQHTSLWYRRGCSYSRRRSCSYIIEHLIAVQEETPLYKDKSKIILLTKSTLPLAISLPNSLFHQNHKMITRSIRSFCLQHFMSSMERKQCLFKGNSERKAPVYTNPTPCRH